MGYPGLTEHNWIKSKCSGQFIRHHTIDKSWTKKSTEAAMMQSLADLLHQELHEKKDTYFVREKKKETAGANDPDVFSYDLGKRGM